MSQSTTQTGQTSTQSLAHSAGLLESMPKQFVPVEHENRISARWEKARAFRADPGAVLRGERKPFSMFIPPPNVTGALHLGHALNNTLQDVLTRYHRMAGYETLWMPGTDHAGIATQAVVEKRLRKDGELKGPLKDADRNGGWTREKFVTKVQEWKDEYEARITNQLKAMGVSCDFSRQRFTMDPVCAAAVREAFFRLFSDGLIYRGKRLVNWDPALQTAVADDECYDEEINGNFYYLRYPLVHASSQDPAIRTGGRENVDPLPLTWGELARRGYPGAEQFDSDVQAWVTVATTRPETYLGDTAVAVNPHDPRAKALRGVFIELPVVGRIIPIIEDEYVVLPREVAERLGREDDAKDPKSAFASGFLKVTPAHDQNDWELGLRHGLAVINVMAPDGSISSTHGWSDVGNATIFVGKKREDARKSVVKYFEEHSIQGSAYKLLEQIKPYRHSVKHSDRSKAIVEPYLSDQWYVKVTDPRMAKAANETLAKPEALGTGHQASGKAEDTTHLTFHPERYAKTFQQWHEGIRDWCISRQLWWGHRIPVWGTKQGHQHDLRFLMQVREWEKAGRVFAKFTNDQIETDAGAGAKFPHYICVRSPDDREVIAAIEADGFTQDPDVLDTWFSSALWPLSTLGWPDAAAAEKMLPGSQFTGLLAAFNPSSVLSTAREIITLWVSRMVMMNRYMLPPRAPGHFAATWRKVIDLNREEDFAANSKPFGPDPNKGPSFSDMLMNCVDGMSVEATRLSDGQKVDPSTLFTTNTSSKDLYEFRIQVQSPELVKTWQLVEAGFEPDFTRSSAKASTGPVPFRNVFVHAVVQDGEGKKMSKSAGNGVDPLDIIASHGADAMRFTLCQMSTQTQDVRMPVQVDSKTGKNTSPKFDLGRSFASKLWNACRFALTMLEGSASASTDSTPIDPASLSLVDRWMLSRLQRGIAACEKAIHAYEFNSYAEACYDLLWRDFCDFYLEAIKPTVAQSAEQRAVLRNALETIVRLLHPMMPYVTEAAYEKLVALPSRSITGLTLSSGRASQVSDGATPLLCVSAWPEAKNLIDEASEQAVQRLRELATTINQVRATYNVPPKARVTLFASENVRTLLTHAPKVVETLSGLNAVEAQGAKTPDGPGTAKVLFEGQELRLTGLPQVEASEGGSSEKDRLSKERAEISKKIAVLEGRLSNPGYIGRAPAKLVEETKSQLHSAQNELKVIDDALKALG
ncbi:MAG: valine--tRNA ligase [Phycisphaerales bacterium]|nr:valine--tRNA ligase [Phycisphaerales bacterium]